MSLEDTVDLDAVPADPPEPSPSATPKDWGPPTPPRTVLSWPAERFRSVARAMLIAASTDKERPHLSAVCVRRLNGVLTLSATDGTWLLRWKETEGMTDEEGNRVDRSPFQCLIPRRVLESFVAATKKPLELERVLLTGAAQSWELATILDVRRHEFLQVPEEFPDVDKVIPGHVAPSVSAIGVGSGMMARVANAFSLGTGSQDTTIFWQFSGDAASPLICTSPYHAELLAVVMPQRTDGGDNAVPEKPSAEGKPS